MTYQSEMFYQKVVTVTSGVEGFLKAQVVVFLLDVYCMVTLDLIDYCL